MGQPMVSRLLQAGYPVTVWNRSPEKMAASMALGAIGADSALSAVAQAQIVITMLEAGPIVKSVLISALDGMSAGTLLIDMSSTQQSEALDIAQMVDAANKQLSFMDAPVSGGVVGAQAGTLAIMAGASPEDYARAEPVLCVMGRPTRVGAPGSGQLAKLCNQLIVGGTLGLIAEALLLAQAGGADPVAVRTALRGGFAESRLLEVHGQRMLERNFMPGGQVKSQSKDMENVLAAAKAANLVLPQAQLISDLYLSLMDSVPKADQSAALLAIENRNAGYRVGTLPDQLPE